VFQPEDDLVDEALNRLDGELYTLKNGAEMTGNRGQPDGYASLDSEGKVPVTQLPDSSRVLLSGNDFDETATPVLVADELSADQLVARVIVKVTTAAAGGAPTIQVGTAIDTDYYMDTSVADLTAVGVYESKPFAAPLGAPDDIVAAITADGQTFSGKVWVELLVPTSP
jgi:hypothetical protein